MKSLKRTLSLVLVLAMCFSLLGVASATSFTDDANVQYTEAVDVMTGIGAINGYTDGTFRPTGTITREEAAKLVAYTVLGATLAKTLTVSATGFTDVEASRWSAPYITYLVNKGIIDGMGDGTFAPTANVTGYQLAKMLLCAIGYGQNGEFTGSSWELNTAILANQQGIFANAKTVSYSAAATREEAALYCFNALFIHMVKYDANSNTYYNAFYAGYNVLQHAEGYYTIANTVYSSLAKSSTTIDDCGRPATIWVYGSPLKTIATVTATPIFTSNVAVYMAATKLALENKGYTFGTTIDIYTNGYFQDNVNVTAGIAAFPVLGGNGVTFEMYADAAMNVTSIVMVNTYLAKVTIAETDVSTTTTVDERVLNVLIGSRTTKATPANTAGFDAAYTAVATAVAAGTDAYLLAVPYLDNTMDNAKVLTLTVPVTKTLAATSYTGTSFVADGTTYMYSKFAGTTVSAFTPFTAIFDTYGYVIGTANVVTASTYAVVLRSTPVVDAWGATGTYSAELLLANGTKSAVSTGTTNPDASGSSVVGTVVSYSVNSLGVYTLTDISAPVSGTTLSLTKGVSAFGWNGTTYYANAKTLFFVRTGTSSAYTYNTYVGIGAVPSYSGTVAGEVVATGTIANIVYLLNPTDAGTTSTNTIFVSSAYQAVTTLVNGLSVTYYIAPAIVNGTVTTLNLAEVPALGVYTGMTTNAAGFVALSASTPTANNFASKALQAANGVIKVDTIYYGYTSDVAVYTYSASTGTITVSSLTAIATAVTTSGTFSVNTLGQITGLFFAVA